MSRRCTGWLLAGLTLIAVAPRADAACDDPPSLIGTITPPPGAFPGEYVAAQLGPGSTYYTDDSFSTITRVPPEFECAQWIMTSNSDAGATNASFLTFQLLERAEVHVLYDRRVAIQPERSAPTWLTSQFTFDHTAVDVDAADEFSTVNDPNMDFVVYRKQFPAGSVTLGANAAAGADFTQGAETVSSNYIVVVTKPRPPIPTVSCPVPPSLISGITPPPSGNSYLAAHLVAGTGTSSQYYTDRANTHLLSKLAREVACAHWLKTPNDDKARTDVGLPSFNVAAPAVAYVLYDTREELQGEPLPAWLTSGGFEYTHRMVDITEPNRDMEFALYAKKVPAGALALGGNSQPPASTNSSYIVAVAPDGDADGVPDVTDNCPSAPNTAQPDSDLDGLGDACDPTADSFGYRMTVDGGPGGPAFDFDDISASGTSIALGNDVVSGAIAMPFAFEFYGTARANYYVSSNGFLTFLASQPAGSGSGQLTPSAGTPQALVAGFWEDLNPPANSVRRQTLGSAPNRVLVVQFTNVPHVPSGNNVTFQFKLFEGTNEIEVHYLTAPSDGGTHSAGIENDTGTVGLSFLFGNASLTGRAVRYSPNRRVAVRGYGTGVLTDPTVLAVDVPDVGPVLDVDLAFELKGLFDLGYISVDAHDVQLEHETTDVAVFDGLGSFLPRRFAVLLDDEATGVLVHNETEQVGRFQPEGGPLSLFDGLDADGEWRLRISGTPDVEGPTVLTEWNVQVLVDATGDSDLDGLIDQLDNCPDMPNAPQSDYDGDGQGDFCDISDDIGLFMDPNQSFDPANYRWTGASFDFAPDFVPPPDLVVGAPGLCIMHSITTDTAAIVYNFTAPPPANGFECCAWQARCGTNGCVQNVCAPTVECTGAPSDPECCRFNVGVELFAWGSGQGAATPTDTDGDGRVNTCDSFRTNPNYCADTDHDQCDDCSSGTFNPANDHLNCLPEPGVMLSLSAGVALVAALARRRRVG